MAKICWSTPLNRKWRKKKRNDFLLSRLKIYHVALDSYQFWAPIYQITQFHYFSHFYILFFWEQGMHTLCLPCVDD